MDEQISQLENDQNRRSIRNIVVHRPMQREFTLITIAVMMLSAVAMNFLIHHTLQEIISENVSGFGKIGAYSVLSDASYELVVRITLVMFITIITVGIFGVFFLHRVAGPVYRFHQTFLRLKTNDIPRNDIKLRDKDFFKEVAGDLNEILKLLRKRKLTIEQIKEIVSSVSDQTKPEDIRHKLEEIRSISQS